MKIKVNEEELRKELDFKDAENLLVTLKGRADYILKGYLSLSREQVSAVMSIQAFLRNCTIED